MYSANSLKAELNERGWRLTPQRETILEIFQQLPEGNHLSAEALHDKLVDIGQPISQSTIYRTVKLMARMGIVRELEFAEGHKYYEINHPYPHHHHHLICVHCSKAIEFRSDPVLNIGAKTAEQEGFHLLDCQLLIHAICPKCQRSIAPR